MKNNVANCEECVPARYDFLDEWMKVAEGRDLFMRFFCFFLSFNHLYSKDHCLHADEENDSHDMPVIARFLVRTFDRAVVEGREPYHFPNTLDLQKCSLGKHVHILAEPELQWIDTEPYIKTAMANAGIIRDSHEWNMVKIFLRIYKIRCNLFHGDKTPTEDDDVKRVADSCDVLESFLRWYVKCGFYEPEKMWLSGRVSNCLVKRRHVR